MKRTVVEVEAVDTIGYTCVGALAEVETSPACGALVAAATDAGLTQRGALLAALPIVTEKATGALGHTHPGERGNERERKEGHGVKKSVIKGKRGTQRRNNLCFLEIYSRLKYNKIRRQNYHY